MNELKKLACPWPYFGGKSGATAQVWEAFGDVKNYVEPFMGSAAMLLGAPEGKRIETINDFDGFVSLCAKFPHVFSICCPFLFGVSGFFCRKAVAGFALCLSSITRPSVFVKIRNWLCAKASIAFFLEYFTKVSNLVFDIFIMRIPAQIRKIVVGFVTVWIVASFHAIRTISCKCQKHQAMHGLRYHNAIDVKANFFVTTFVKALPHLAWFAYLSARSIVAPLSFVGKYFSVLSSKVAVKAGNWMRCIGAHAYILPKPTFNVNALLQHGWHVRKWKARKGYAMTAEAVANSAGETLWCSPHCVQAPEFMTNQPLAIMDSAQAATKNIAQLELA